MRKKSNGLHGIDPYKNKARLTNTSDEPFFVLNVGAAQLNPSALTDIDC